jgi:hypothetical protein
MNIQEIAIPHVNNNIVGSKSYYAVPTDRSTESHKILQG